MGVGFTVLFACLWLWVCSCILKPEAPAFKPLHIVRQPYSSCTLEPYKSNRKRQPTTLNTKPSIPAGCCRHPGMALLGCISRGGELKVIRVFSGGSRSLSPRVVLTIGAGFWLPKRVCRPCTLDIWALNVCRSVCPPIYRSIYLSYLYT